jgi:hypothetical protein
MNRRRRTRLDVSILVDGRPPDRPIVPSLAWPLAIAVAQNFEEKYNNEITIVSNEYSLI